MFSAKISTTIATLAATFAVAVAAAPSAQADIVNDIKIGNRSQFVQAGTHPGQTATPGTLKPNGTTARPQTSAFKIQRFVISGS